MATREAQRRDPWDVASNLITTYEEHFTSRSLVLPIRKMQQSNLPLTGNGHSFFVKSFVEIPLNAF